MIKYNPLVVQANEYPVWYKIGNFYNYYSGSGDAWAVCSMTLMLSFAYWSHAIVNVQFRRNATTFENTETRITPIHIVFTNDNTYPMKMAMKVIDIRNVELYVKSNNILRSNFAISVLHTTFSNTSNQSFTFNSAVTEYTDEDMTYIYDLNRGKQMYPTIRYNLLCRKLFTITDTSLVYEEDIDLTTILEEGVIPQISSLRLEAGVQNPDYLGQIVGGTGVNIVKVSEGNRPSVINIYEFSGNILYTLYYWWQIGDKKVTIKICNAKNTTIIPMIELRYMTNLF